MAVPDYQTMMLPVLRLFAEGATNVGACLPALKAQLGITDEEGECHELCVSGPVHAV